MNGACAGMRVLIVEDEFYLADDLAQELRKQGAEVIGPVGTVDAASAVVDERRIDYAVLDMNLHGDMAFPIADRLREHRVPFLIATGYNSASLPDRFSALPRVEKPFGPAEVIPHVAAARGEVRV